MPNDLQAFSYQMLAKGLQVLSPRLALVQKLNFVYDPIPQGVQAQIKIPFTKPGTVSNVAPSVTAPAPQDAMTDAIYIAPDRWKRAEFYVKDDELATVSDEWMMLQMRQKVVDLATFVNADVVDGCYRKFYRTAGTVGTPLFSASAAPSITAARILAEQLAPPEDRSIVLSPASYYDAVGLPQFQNMYQSNQPGVQAEAEIPRRFGFDWLYDQQMAGHITGAAAGYVTGVNAVGAATIAISGGSGAWVEGDIVTIAGSSYAVRAGSTTTQLNIIPALKTATAAGVAITKMASHSHDLAFQRQAVAFVTRPFSDADNYHNKLGKIVTSLTDPVSKLSLRLVISSQNNQTQFEFQTFYGFGVIRPEFGVRLVY
jgi:P22 coat protein - gene protein 5